MPITDIIIINLDTAKPPKGYTLLERTASGLLAANINAGNNGKRLFLCYTRVHLIFLIKFPWTQPINQFFIRILLALQLLGLLLFILNTTKHLLMTLN